MVSLNQPPMYLETKILRAGERNQPEKDFTCSVSGSILVGITAKKTYR